MHERENNETEPQHTEPKGVPTEGTDLLKMLERYAPYLLKKRVA